MKKGISLISLIITIIVIIILAAIVIFTGLSTPDQANFAKFTSEFSDFDTAVQTDYANKYAEHATNNETRSKAQIYYEIATGGNIDMNDEPVVAGLISDLPVEIRGGLRGVEYYEITDDKNVDNWTRDKFYYEPEEKHYITDEGEVFTLPGYLVVDNTTQKWYVNSSKYYTGEKLSVEANELLNTIKVGDYVNYVPDNSTYTTNSSNTGYNAQTLSTEETTWRIIDVDNSKGKIIITTTAPVNDIYLNGPVGYANGIDELHQICSALYSNSFLNTHARLISLEDIMQYMEINDHTISHRAYYPYGTSVSGTIEHNGILYEKMAIPFQTATFYGYDYATKFKTNTNGISYAYPDNENPVLIKDSSWVTMREDCGVINDFLLGRHWLATQDVYYNDSGRVPTFAIRIFNDGRTGFGNLCGANNSFNAKFNFGIRPIIELNISHIDTSDSSYDGSTSEKAWKLK